MVIFCTETLPYSLNNSCLEEMKQNARLSHKTQQCCHQSRLKYLFCRPVTNFGRGRRFTWVLKSCVRCRYKGLFTHLLPRKSPRDGAVAFSAANTTLIWRQGLQRLQQPVRRRLHPGPCPGKRRGAVAADTDARFQRKVTAAAIPNYTPFIAETFSPCQGQLWQWWTAGHCGWGCSSPRQCPLNVLALTKSSLSLRWQALAKLAWLLRANRKQWRNKYFYFYMFALQAIWRYSTQHIHQELISWGNNRVNFMNTFTFSIFPQASDLAKLL